MMRRRSRLEGRPSGKRTYCSIALRSAARCRRASRLASDSRVEGLRNRGGTAHGADQQDFNLKNSALIFNAELVAGMNLAGRFGSLAV